ncbi:MAG: glycosyltransferase family 4 protein [Candidatus Nitrotoga sp.]|nr:glycosyltransferase family 4 protein [Candidatus Nitrotoga sp.]MBP0116834.1 glycosyltransferase family 4 protein [Candidatus Nitrotoga sp.]MBP0123443.1 glycosyltransferase family 4 protein [Candidatus Nitrotoga sp.]MBP0125963.1 glycosyltransferase family 4 protein [Candidatus Nitrotoga sp.]
MSHYAPLVAALITMLVITIMLFSKADKNIQDIPNERSLHESPTPRIGGVGLMAGLLSAWALMLMSLVWWVLLPLIILFAVSLLDDVRGLPIRQRLIAHIFGAAILVVGSGFWTQGVVVSMLVLLCVVWMINLFNFMDGSDGLAGGMAFFGFTMYGVAALMHGEDTQAMLNFSIAAASLGMLYYNFYPAQVFMGDAGSIPLGFLAAAMGLWGWQQGLWPEWFPLLVFFPFIADASVVLLKRILCREKILKAHREHYYQRLVRIGWGHRNVALFGYILMFMVGVSAIWCLRQSTQWPWLLFLSWGIVYAGLMLTLDFRWKAFLRASA